MQDTIAVTGMVLISAPVGDYDRRLVLLTKEKGKITVFARGARRPNYQWLAGCRPFAFGSFNLGSGRDAYSLRSAEISAYFDELPKDVEAVSYGFYFLELASYYSRENLDGSGTLNLIYCALRALTKRRIPLPLIRFITEVRLMWDNGEFPEADRCAVCGNDLTGEAVFYPGRAAYACRACAGQIPGGIPLSATAVYTYQYVIASPLNKLFAFGVSDEVLRELLSSMARYRAAHLNAPFKSLEVLDMMAGDGMNG